MAPRQRETFFPVCRHRNFRLPLAAFASLDFRATTFMKRIALIALSLFFAGKCFSETPAANSGDDQLQKLAQDFWNWRARYSPSRPTM